ncbi:MAG: hypothetical protein ACI85O_003431 [Saprospiraceae bacterium]|jgi:hypothetical protein
MRYLIFTCFILIFSACNNDATVEEVTSEITKTTENVVDDVKNKQVEEVVIDSPVIVKKAVIELAKEATDKSIEVVKEESKKEEPKKKRKRSKISFEEKSWDFGDIRDGDIVNHDFKFKNIGNATLEIRNVTATCGCTQPSFPFLPIAPGEEGTISVTFNSTGKINEQRPTVTVITNGKPSIVKLNLEGMVRQKL